MSEPEPRGARGARRLLYGLLALLPAAAAIAIAPAASATTSGTLYINNATGSNCSDSYTSTTTAQPWCDFTPVNGATLAPGTEVLLSRGDSWNQALRLTGSGTSSNWITLGAYGTGNLPVIEGSGNANDRTVVITNPDYWHIQDLELTNAGEGLLVMYTTLGHNGLDIHDIDANNLSGIVNHSPVQSDFPQLQYSTGILVDASGAPTTTSGQTAVSGVSIHDNQVYGAVAGIHVNDDPTVSGTPADAASTFTGVNIIHNYLHQLSGPEISLESSSTAHVDSNYLDCGASIYFPQGTTCFFVTDSDYPTIQNNVIVNMPDTGSADETGIDLEYKIHSAYIRGNYFGNNAGAGIELLQLGRAGDYSTGTEISDNTFYNDGTASSSQKGQIAVYNSGSGTPPGASVHDNGYNATAQGLFSNVNGNPNLTNITQANNEVTSSQYVAPVPFNGTQGNGGWQQQAYNTVSWSNLTSYTATTNTWTGLGGSAVNAFQLLPGNAQTQDAWVGREWTAPSSGTIVIHGRVCSDGATAGGGGDGVNVLIEKNGVAQWPATPTDATYQTVAAGDQSGYDTDVTLTVSAGDVIRFVVTSWPSYNTTGDLTSWAPSISYTS